MFKDFDAFLAEKISGRPEFTLAGQKFQCRVKLPWRKYANTLLALQSGVVPEGKTEVDQTVDLLKMMIVPSDRDRFLSLINYEGDEDEEMDDEGVYASNDQVNELLTWLLEYYTGKASESENISSTTPSTTGKPVRKASLNSPPKG
jgi:hypothetical protein